jgi:hypothetical protein
MAAQVKTGYRPTESKYKGGAEEMYVTYDLAQKTRGPLPAVYPKVKRVYIAGDVEGWKVGDFEKRTGKKVRGVKIDYRQSRGGYSRRGFSARRGSTGYKVSPAKVGASTSTFSQIVPVPEAAEHVRFHRGRLPKKYQQALQNVR